MTIKITNVVIKGLEEIDLPTKKGEQPGKQVEAVVDVTLRIRVVDLLVFNKKKLMKG